MTETLTIVLARMTQAVGDLAANADAMRRIRARHAGADLILYPELQLIGYPPEDLVLQPALAERAAALLAELAAETGDGGPPMRVGSVARGAAGRTDIMLASTASGRVGGAARPDEWTHNR